jgi:hypothetical protein
VLSEAPAFCLPIFLCDSSSKETLALRSLENDATICQMCLEYSLIAQDSTDRFQKRKHDEVCLVPYIIDANITD